MLKHHWPSTSGNVPEMRSLCVRSPDCELTIVLDLMDAWLVVGAALKRIKRSIERNKWLVGCDEPLVMETSDAETAE